jgi:hypothetical protein
MMKMSWQLDRRTFLCGTGVALGLPLFDCMHSATAAPANGKELPRRMACIFFPNGVSLPPVDHAHHKEWHWFPHGGERDFQFTKTLNSLEPLRNDLSILGGLSHRTGWKLPGHSVSDVFLTGSKIGGGVYTNSISIDQLVAQQIGVHTRLDSLQLSTTGGIGQTGRTHTLSFTREGQPIPAEDNLRRAFNRMFGVDDDTSAMKALAHKKSMLDLVLAHARSLSPRLGRLDQQKLNEYLSSVRDIERRIERAEQWLDIPKAKIDPDSLNLDSNREAPLDYIRAMYDLMFLAFQTDTTRVATYLLGTEGGGQISDVFPRALDLDPHHNLSHYAKKSDDGFKNWALWDQFLTQQLAYFLQRLKSTSEGDSNLLDRTLIFYGCSTSTLHLARNYPLILAGGQGLGLKQGRYLKFDEEKTPLSNLFVTMLNVMGVETERFSESTGAISDLTA